jgi:hypothetical protein
VNLIMDEGLVRSKGEITARIDILSPAERSEAEWSTIRRGLLNCSRQWGKSTVTAARAVHRAYCIPVMVVSPTARQSGEFLRKAAGFARRLGIRPRGDGDNEISLRFPNGSRIVGLPGMEDTVRGFSAVSLMLIDEASRVSDDLYQAVRPMLAVEYCCESVGAEERVFDEELIRRAVRDDLKPLDFRRW